MSYRTLKSRLNGSIDNLPPSSLDNFINDALEDIYRDYDWGFLYKRDYLRTPAMINSGTASVIKFSELVTLDATASALIIALTANDVQLIERQFRTASNEITGRSFAYNIIDYDVTNPSAVILTIDPPYLDKTNSAISYEILKIYYAPPFVVVNNSPIIDFRKWEYIIARQSWRRLRLDISLDELMLADPARYSSGEPFCVVASSDSNDSNEYIPLFEFYPAPRYERIYEVVYQRKGRKYSNDGTDDEAELPASLTDELVLNRARVKAYEFVIAKAQELQLKNVGRFQNLMILADKQKEDLLDKAKKTDREIYPRGFITQYSAIPYFDYPNLYGNNLDSGYEIGIRNTMLIDF